MRAADAVHAVAHPRSRGDRTPLIDPLAWDQAKSREAVPASSPAASRS